MLAGLAPAQRSGAPSPPTARLDNFAGADTATASFRSRPPPELEFATHTSEFSQHGPDLRILADGGCSNVPRNFSSAGFRNYRPLRRILDRRGVPDSSRRFSSRALASLSATVSKPSVNQL